MADTTSSSSSSSSLASQERTFALDHLKPFLSRVAVRVLAPEDDLVTLCELVRREGGRLQESGSLSEVLLALDFDQTITHVKKDKGVVVSKTARGGEEAIASLDALKNDGVGLAIITANAPNVGAAHVVSDDLCRIGLDGVFDTRPLDRSALLAALAPTVTTALLQAQPAGLLYEEAVRLAAAVLVLCSERKVVDLARLGRKRLVFNEMESMRYQLQVLDTGQDDWSATQTLTSGKGLSLFNPVSLLAFLAEWSAAFVTSTSPDRLFIKEDGTAYTGSELELMVRDLFSQLRPELVRSGPTGIDSLFAEPAVIKDWAGGVRLAHMSTIICAKYNKPEALEFAWQDMYGGRHSVIVFADDNPDNVLAVFTYFVEKVRSCSSPETLPRVVCVWLPPPSGGKLEGSAETIETLRAVSELCG